MVCVQLPSGWVRVRSGDCIRWLSGGTPARGRPEYYDGSIPWAIIGDLNDGPVARTQNCISQLGLRNSAAKWVEEDSVLIALYGSIGKLGVAKMRLTTNQAIAFARTYPLKTMFVFYYMLAQRNGLRRLGRGGTQLNLNLRILNDYPLVIPPLVEQRAIVAKIEALFSELEKGIEQLQTAKQQLKQYRQAVLKAAFEGKLTAEWRSEQQAAGKLPGADELLEQITKAREERYQQQLREWKQAVVEWEAAGGKESGRKKPVRPSRLKRIPAPTQAELPFAYTMPGGWCWIRVGDLTLGVEYGTSKKSSDEGCYPVLRMGNIQDCRFDWTDLAFSNDVEEFVKYKLRPNDVLFNRTNSPELVGKTAVFKGEREALFAGYLIRINQIGSIVDADYLNFYLNSMFARQYGNRVKTDGVNQSNINGTKLAAYPFPYCCMDEQRAIVSEVESRFSVLEVLDKAIDEGLKHAEALRQSILRKAFEGRLLSETELTAVRNDPEYEPADKLLERIRAERGQEKQPSRARRTSTKTRRKTVRQYREEVEKTVSEAK